MFHDVLLVSAVQRSGSAVPKCVSSLSLCFGFPFYLGHHRALSLVPGAI